MEIVKHENDLGVIFDIEVDGRRAAAELSRIDSAILAEITPLILPQGKVYYFNRLIVDEKLRGKGLSKLLLDNVANWADLNSITILLDINPYGKMSKEDLQILYGKYGFEEYSDTDFQMIRKPK